MSWSASGKAIVDYGGVALHLDEKFPQSGYGDRESADDIELAAAAVRNILGLQPLDFKGSFGFGVFSVRMNGHSNPNRKPEGGWANDYLPITITKEK